MRVVDKYYVGDKVMWYDRRTREWHKAIVEEVHMDDPPHPYYTLSLKKNKNRIPQTTKERLLLRKRADVSI